MTHITFPQHIKIYANYDKYKNCCALVILLKTARHDPRTTHSITIWSFPHNRPFYSGGLGPFLSHKPTGGRPKKD